MNEKPQSLARRLTGRLILLQMLTLLAFAMCVPLAEFTVGDRSFYEPDPSASDDIADALRFVDGKIAVVPDNDFTDLIIEAPNLWFIAVNEAGQRLEHGAVPQGMRSIADTIGVLNAVEIRDDGVTKFDALLRVEASEVGRVRILFGQGPRTGPALALLKYAAGNVLPFLILILIFLTATTSLVIPRLIHGSMQGLRRAASHAETIDVEKPGRRLPTEDVPTEIVALVDAMNAALKRIDDSYERQQRFLADAAHELKTPIAILQNRIELLATDEIGNRLLLDVQRIANLAEQLLDLQRLDHQKTAPREVDLVILAGQVVADMAPMAINGGYEPDFTTEVTALTVLGDGSAIERALINLYQNAIAYGGNRGRILVRVCDDHSVEVCDDGYGVPQEQRDEIFEPFHRLKPVDRGAGLGLSLVREIMRRHDGSVSVTDSATGGACFVLHFSQRNHP